MKFAEFEKSLKDPEPPPGISKPVEALWYCGKKDWTRAHEIVQDLESKEAAWEHALLHREEGDAGNARYWYPAGGEGGKQRIY